MLKRHGFHAVVDTSGYVSTISDGDSRVINEKDNGAFSGWMYTLNGEHVNKSVKEQTVEDGDEIVFHYTDDYRIEDESLDISEAESIIAAINSIPEEITLDDEVLVNEAMDALSSLDVNDPVLSGLITKALRSKLDLAYKRIKELKGEKEQDDAEKAARALEEANKNGLEKIKKLAEQYAGKILPKDEADYRTVIMSAVSDLGKAIDVTETKRAAKSLKVKKIRAKSKSRKFTVSWKKVSGASGYQVQMKKKGGKWKLIKKATKAKIKTGKLKKGKKYQFRIRTYTIISKDRYYGKWTRSKAVKCK